MNDGIFVVSVITGLLEGAQEGNLGAGLVQSFHDKRMPGPGFLISPEAGIGVPGRRFLRIEPHRDRPSVVAGELRLLRALFDMLKVRQNEVSRPPVLVGLFRGDEIAGNRLGPALGL